MPRTPHLIETRQKSDTLFLIPDPSAEPPTFHPLAGSASISLGPVLAEGYAIIAALVISDQPFTVKFFEGVTPDGPFVLSETFVATAVGAQFAVTERFVPTGSFMKMTLENTSTVKQTVLDLLVQGVPVS